MMIRSIGSDLGRIVWLALIVTILVGGNGPLYGDDGEKKRPVDKVLALSATKAMPATLKIVRGQPAQAGRYPFQVALVASFVPEGQEHFGQFCGGSLIDQRWVLTAAHCVPDTEPEEVDVYVGSTTLPAGEAVAEAALGVRLHVAEIIPHHDYDEATHDNDIAVLKLVGPAPDRLKTAMVATPELEQQLGGIGSDVTVIGWGATSQGGATTPILREVVVQVQDRGLCEENYQQAIPTTEITDNMFCAGVSEGGKDSCQGDSGGFIGADVVEGNFVQIGIVSWGIGCAQPGLFGVYTRVANYGAWIDETMESF